MNEHAVEILASAPHASEKGVRALLHGLGVTIIEDESFLGETWLGAYSHRYKTVFLRPGLAADKRALTLAHEAAHALYGHSGCNPEQEATARSFAALYVVDPADYHAGVAEGLDPATIGERQGLPRQAITDYGKYVQAI